MLVKTHPAGNEDLDTLVQNHLSHFQNILNNYEDIQIR